MKHISKFTFTRCNNESINKGDEDLQPNPIITSQKGSGVGAVFAFNFHLSILNCEIYSNIVALLFHTPVVFTIAVALLFILQVADTGLN